jgi:hypothetical protein
MTQSTLVTLTGNGPIPAPGRWRIAFVAARRRFIKKEAIKTGALNLSPGARLGLSRNRRNKQTKNKAQDCKALHRVLHVGMRMRASEVVDQIGQRFPSAETTLQTTKTTCCPHSLDFAANGLGGLAESERELNLFIRVKERSARAPRARAIPLRNRSSPGMTLYLECRRLPTRATASKSVLP